MAPDPNPSTLGRGWRRSAVAAVTVAALAAAGIAVAARVEGDPPNPREPLRRAAAPAAPGPAGLPTRPCDWTADSADELEESFDGASGGETVCLAPGDFGTFRGGAKDDVVVVRPQPGADARIALDFDGAVNVRVEGVTVTAAAIRGPSRRITVAHARFTGLAVINADQMAGAEILFQANVHADVDTCVECFQGRVHVEGDSGEPAGVVIADSVFSGGNSDGVRADAHGVEIVGNEFTGLRDEDPFHTDPIQISGGKRVVIRSNFIHDNSVSAGITMADGGSANLVEDNVIAGDDSTWAMTWFADDGSVIRHNTLVDGACRFSQRCGVINVGAKPGARPGGATDIRDNVLGGISNDGGGGAVAFLAEGNLTRDPIPGAGANAVGLPEYRGPLDTREGYRLAPGSPGVTGGAAPGIR